MARLVRASSVLVAATMLLGSCGSSDDTADAPAELRVEVDAAMCEALAAETVRPAPPPASSTHPMSLAVTLDRVAGWTSRGAPETYAYIAVAFADELEALAEVGGPAQVEARTILAVADDSDPTAEDLRSARIAVNKLVEIAADVCEIDLDAADAGAQSDAAAPRDREERCAVVYLEPTAPLLQIEAVETALRGVDGLESLAFIDQEATYAEFERLFSDQPDFVEDSQPEDLPTTFKALRDRPWGANELDRLEMMPGVRQVVSDTDFCY